MGESDYPQLRRGYRFGDFQVDLRSGELLRRGIRVRLQEQPFQVLVALLERPGEVVLREEVRKRLWPADTFVDFENSLNSAVNRLRDALGDAAENPVFIETLPRRGYRFLAPVQELRDDLPPEPVQASVAVPVQASVPVKATQPVQRPWRHAFMAGLLMVGAALGGWAWWRSTRSPAIPEGKLMLAILPFEDLTGSGQHQYFVEGLTEELILQLSRLQPGRLGVIARTSILQYRGTKKPVSEVGRELGVAYVLEGSVRLARAGADQPSDRVKVTAQLIKVQDQSHLWAESYEHALTDFFEIQTDVAARVAGSLAMELLPQARRFVKPEAQTAYLKGRFHWNQRSQSGGGQTEKAVEFFQQAVQLDANHAQAHASLAAGYLSLAVAGLRPVAQMVPLARAANERALAADPNLAVAHLNLARIVVYADHDWNGATKLFEKAQSLDPSSPDAPFYHAILLTLLSQFDAAQRQLDLAKKVDPLAPSPLAFEAMLANRRGDFEHARELSRRHGELLGEPLASPHFVGALLALRGKCEEALALMKTAESLGGNLAIYASERAALFARCGNRAEAVKMRDLFRRQSPYSAFHLGAMEAGMGNHAQAYQLLETAVRLRDPSLPMLQVDPLLDGLRKEPRFGQLLRSIGLPE